MVSTTAFRSSDVSLKTALAYSLSVGGVSFVLNALGPLQDVYARYYGLEFSQMAFATLVSQVLSAIANPLVGVLADRHCPALISRKWWVIIAFSLLVLACHHLLVPPSRVSTAYLTFWLTAALLCWVLFDAPHLAWGEHLALNYDGRTRTFGVRSFTVSVGALAFYVIPFFPVFGTTNVTPETLRCAGALSYLVWAPVVYITARYVPAAHMQSQGAPDSILRSLTLVLSNKPFRLLLGVTALRVMGEGMWCSLAFVAFDYYYGLGSKLAMMYFVSLLLTAVSTSPLTRMSTVMGKRRTLVLLQVTFVLLAAIPIAIEPRWDYTYLVLLTVLSAVLLIMSWNGVVTNAILADTIDYGRWKHGRSPAAGYFAVLAFVSLIGGGIGASLGMGIMGHMGFSAKGITDVAEARQGLRIVFFFLPALLTILTLGLIGKLPICARRAAMIRRRIELRDKGRDESNAPGLAQGV